jgi:hypothetical protein
MSQATFDDSLRRAAQNMEWAAKEARFRNDPVLWAEEVLGAVLWSKQKEILRSLAQNKRTAVKSSHSIGKTYVCAIATCWWICTRDDAMVQSTAPTYQQVHSLLWEEIRKMHTRNNLVGRVTLGDQWLKEHVSGHRSKDILVGEGKKPADSNIHGFHGTHRPDGVLALLDEACGVATSIFTGAEAITTAGFDRTLAVGNPDDPNTEFGRIFDEAQDEWNLITVSAYDTPNFTGEDKELLERYKNEPDKLKIVYQILGSMPQPEWIESRRRDWGEESPRFLSKVLAQFPKTSVDSLFSGADIETAHNNVIEPQATDFRVLAVDVARYGEDKTVILENFGGRCEVVDVMTAMDTMEIAARVHKYAVERQVDQVRVDGVGVGGGVVDRLINLSRSVDRTYVVVEMTASAMPPDRTLHRNARAYWYDSAKTQMRNALVQIIENKELRKELGTIRYMYPNGILQIESKEDIRRRGDKSPDYVDALVMAIAPINNIVNDPLSSYRIGQEIEIDVLADMNMMVSLY